MFENRFKFKFPSAAHDWMVAGFESSLQKCLLEMVGPRSLYPSHCQLAVGQKCKWTNHQGLRNISGRLRFVAINQVSMEMYRVSLSAMGSHLYIQSLHDYRSEQFIADHNQTSLASLSGEVTSTR
jgi:hypothetical protein